MKNGLEVQAELERGPASSSPVPPVDVSCLPPLAARALQIADEAVVSGVAETNHRNRGPVVDQVLVGVHRDRPSLLCLARYGGDPCRFCEGRPDPLPECLGAPWCARFARWCYERAAAELVPELREFEGAGDLASHFKWYEWARARGFLVRTPRPGDVGLIFTEHGHGHVVLVASVDGDALWTREGNSDDRCAARRRPIASITHFVRLV